MNSHAPKPSARFCSSLHPEIFHALKVLGETSSSAHSAWRIRSLERFPRDRWALHLPGALWTSVPDVLDIGPTSDIGTLVSALERTGDRLLQERFLIGLLHDEDAVTALLEGRIPVGQIVASLPRIKREWLGHIGLYPVEPEVEEALEYLLRSPRSFRADIVATVGTFWEATFAETWEELQSAMQASVEQKKRLYDRCSFREFLRHTLLPVELSGNKLRALRGGYQLPLDLIKECIFTPSAFNDSRFWTTCGDGGLVSPWFPYCEPELKPHGDSTDSVEIEPDVALIFRALGDATRFAMMSLVGRYPRSAAELASLLSVSKPTVSHHLHILRSAGLVHETDHQGSVLISLDRSVLQRLSDLTVRRLLESREPVELTRSRRTR